MKVSIWLDEYNYLNEKDLIRKERKKKSFTTKKEVTLQNKRELSLLFGTVWGVNDFAVPFDNKRKDDDFKETLRPCLVLETPDDFGDNYLVWMAPGTSKFHKIKDKIEPCFYADPQYENVRKPTYFLLYFEWFAKQKTVINKFLELSEDGKTKLKELVNEME